MKMIFIYTMKKIIDENYYNGIRYHFDGSDPNDLMKNQKEIATIDNETVSDDSTYSSEKIEGDFAKVITLSQEEYDELEVKDPKTIYIINDV